MHLLSWRDGAAVEAAHRQAVQVVVLEALLRADTGGAHACAGVVAGQEVAQAVVGVGLVNDVACRLPSGFVMVDDQIAGSRIYFLKSNFLLPENHMPEIRMRPKHQVTLPASIVRAANLQLDDKLEVSYINGNIIIAPKKVTSQPSDVMAFAGIGSGLWGATPAAVENTVKKLRNDLAR